MKQFQTRLAIFSALVCLLLSLNAAAQEFRKSYEIGQGGSISVRNVSGDVTVTGYEGSAVLVLGFKEGRDRDRVWVEDNSAGNNVDVRARYPENCDCNASIRFEVKVPRASYKFDQISSTSGDVEVTGVSGDLLAKSTSGAVTVRGVTGAVNAKSTSGNVHVGEINGTVSGKSTSGNVEVEIMQLSGAGDMEFASTSGNVRVKLPANLDADVRMSTMSGGLKTDFPLTIEEPERGPGRRAAGRVGGGSRNLRLSSTSGSVSLLMM
jgi:Putative adhesin